MNIVIILCATSMMIAAFAVTAWAGAHFLGRTYLQLYGAVEEIPLALWRNLAERYLAVSKRRLYASFLVGLSLYPCAAVIASLRS